MIINAFSQHLKEYAADIPATIILSRWLKDILEKSPGNNIEKIIHTELTLLKGETGIYAVVGTSMSGQKLLENLNKFILSYENNNFARWVHNINPTDFDDNNPE